MKKVIILIIVAISVVFTAVFVYSNQDEGIKEENIKTLKIGEVLLDVEIADTDAKRIKGLSGRESLAENGGLLFEFKGESYYGIWMKNMNFPIDIAWLDKNKKIIHIKNNVSPDTYPEVFYAFKKDKPILNLYVLETNANFLEKSNIKVGDILEF